MARREGAGRNGTGSKDNGPSKPERDHLRRTMREQGFTTEQIALAMMAKWPYRPRQAWRHAHGWTQQEVADRYNKLINDPNSPVSSNRISDYEAWPRREDARPTLTVLRNLAIVFGTVEWKLVDFDDLDQMNSHERAALRPPPESPSTEDNAQGKQTTQLILPATPAPANDNGLIRYADVAGNLPSSIADWIMTVAYRSRDHAEDAQGYAMSEATLEEVTADVERLIKATMYTDPLTEFPDVVHVRDRIYRLLELRQYPKQTTHLYYLAAIVCALLADISLSVGFQRAALEQSRASWAYAEIIGHNSLRLWSRITQANVVRESRPHNALSLVESATDWATEPVAQAVLYSRIALYSALTAKPYQARTALDTAVNSYDSSTGRSELFDDLGGLFAQPRGRFMQYTARTTLELGDLDAAESGAAEAVELYESGPLEQRAIGSEASLRIDLGHARLLKGDIDAAVDALRPVLALPPSHRLEWIGFELKNFSHTLHKSDSIAASATGRQLAQDIDGFLAVTVSDNFPTPDGF